MQRIVRNYYKKLYAKKLENLGKICKFLETYKLPKLIQEETECLYKPITTSENEAVLKKLPAHKSPGPVGWIHRQILLNIQRRANY